MPGITNPGMRLNLILRCWNDKDFYRRGAEAQRLKIVDISFKTIF
jgi:hypothetical protein